MNIVLWILQVILAFQFTFMGINHLTLPPNLPAFATWMYDLPPALHYISGTAEILAAAGLLLPAISRIQTRLVPLAAAGLVLLMIGGSVFHIPRGEIVPQVVMNVGLALTAAFVAYGRWKLAPLTDRQDAGTTAVA